MPPTSCATMPTSTASAAMSRTSSSAGATTNKTSDLRIPAGLALEEARKLVAGYGAELDPGTRAYIDASLAEDDKRVRARRLRYRLAAAAAVLFAIVAALAGWQWQVARKKNGGHRSSRHNLPRPTPPRRKRQTKVAESEKTKKEVQQLETEKRLREAQINESKYLGARAKEAAASGKIDAAKAFLSLALPKVWGGVDRPFVSASTGALPEIVARDTLKAMLIGHTGDIYALSVSPNGDQIMTGSADGTARLWDAKTGAPLHALKGHEKYVVEASYSSDGKQESSPPLGTTRHAFGMRKRERFCTCSRGTTMR